MGLISFSSEGYLIYSLTYLLLMPEYFCVNNGVAFNCESEDTCLRRYNSNSNGYSNGHYVDWYATTSLHNWVETFNLRCSTKYEIGFITASFYIGQFFGTSILSQFGDKIGRIEVLRKTLLVSFIL